MSAFDKVIGYEAIKTELRQICDVIQNRRVYEELGARLPHGLLLYGKPGLGKTLIAKCFIEESGLCAYTEIKAAMVLSAISPKLFKKPKKPRPASSSLMTWTNLQMTITSIAMLRNMWPFSPGSMK